MLNGMRRGNAGLAAAMRFALEKNYSNFWGINETATLLTIFNDDCSCPRLCDNRDDTCKGRTGHFALPANSQHRHLFFKTRSINGLFN
jgi:hypothetical protein